MEKITRKIENKIGLKIKDLIGSGSYGVAFNTSDPWKVVKITRDKKESSVAVDLMKKPRSFAARVYYVSQILFDTEQAKNKFVTELNIPSYFSDKDEKFYIIVLEKTKRLKLLINYLNLLNQLFEIENYDYEYDNNYASIKKHLNIKYFSETLKKRLPNSYQFYNIKLLHRIYQQYVIMVNEVVKFKFTDLNLSNIGISHDNRLIAFDMLSEKEYDKTIDKLQLTEKQNISTHELLEKSIEKAYVNYKKAVLENTQKHLELLKKNEFTVVSFPIPFVENKKVFLQIYIKKFDPFKKDKALIYFSDQSKDRIIYRINKDVKSLTDNQIKDILLFNSARERQFFEHELIHLIDYNLIWAKDKKNDLTKIETDYNNYLNLFYEVKAYAISTLRRLEREENLSQLTMNDFFNKFKNKFTASGGYSVFKRLNPDNKRKVLKLVYKYFQNKKNNHL